MVAKSEMRQAKEVAYLLGLSDGTRAIVDHMSAAIAEIQALVAATDEPDPDDHREAKEQDHADEQHTWGL